MADDEIDIRAEVVNLLLQIVSRERYPSVTMLRMIEDLVTPEERALYAGILMDNIWASRPYPSIPMLRRLLALA